MPDEQSINFDPTLPVAEAFASVPADFKAFLKSSFSVLSKVVEAGKLAELVTQISSQGADGRVALSEAKGFALQAGIETTEAHRLFSAVTFLASAIVNQKDLTAEEFVSVGVRTGFIAEVDSGNVLLLTQAFAANRAPMTKVNRQNRLIHALLPSLTSFQTVVDLRPSFSDDGTAIRFAVPVIIARIVNDSTEDVWVQMSKKQVEQLISDMQEVKRKVEALEEWAGKQPFIPGVTNDYIRQSILAGTGDANRRFAVMVQRASR
jgi:hypothetical protein